MKDKKVESDIGLIEELFELCKNLSSMEAHAIGSYNSTKDEKWLEVKEIIRSIRTKYLSLIVKKNDGQLWCFTPDTKILTLEGFDDIKNIKVGDFVLTHKNRFKKILQKHKRLCDEEILKIKTNYTNIPLLVTKGHLFYIAENLRIPQKDLWKKDYKKPKFIWKEAEKLNRNDFLYFPRYNVVKDIDIINVDYKNKNKFVKFEDNINLKVDKDLMRLIGLYLSEGHHYESINKYGWKAGNIGFSFSRNEEDLANFVIDKLSQKFNYSGKLLYRNSIIEISCGKRIARKFFEQFGNYAHTKKIPSWILKLPEEKLKFLVKGMFEGDGSLNKFSFSYCTVSKEIGHSLRLILNKLGILCNLSNRGKGKNTIIDGRKIISKKDRYILVISGESARKFADLCNFKYDGGKKTSGQFGYVGEDYFLIPILKIDKLNYSGNVYNLGVDIDESYCTFQGIAHNCFSKHTCESCMRLEECSARFLSTKQLESAKSCLEDYTTLFQLFMVLNNHGGENVSNTKSSA